MSVFPYLTQIELWSKFKNLNLSKSWIERKPLISSCKHIFLSWTWGSSEGLSALSTEDGEKNDTSPFRWKDYPSKLFNMSRTRHPWVKLLLFVNDHYDLDVCIKIWSMISAIQRKPHLWYEKDCHQSEWCTSIQ